jgi:hypothetical protein
MTTVPEAGPLLFPDDGLDPPLLLEPQATAAIAITTPNTPNRTRDNRNARVMGASKR